MEYPWRTRIIGLPYWSFKEKLKLIKRHEKYYHIEDFNRDMFSGILYMKRKK